MAGVHTGASTEVDSEGIVVKAASGAGIVETAEGGSEVVRGEGKGEDTAGRVGVGSEAGNEGDIGVVSAVVGLSFYSVRFDSDVFFCFW